MRLGTLILALSSPTAWMPHRISGGLCGVLESGLNGSQGPLTIVQESAAGIVQRQRWKAQTERSGE